MNTLIIILVLIFGLSWIGGIIYYGIQSVRSFIRKDKWKFEDNLTTPTPKRKWDSEYSLNLTVLL